MIQPLRSMCWPALVGLAIFPFGGPALPASPPAVNESARQLPIAAQVDVVIAGGSTGAVAAAVEAARAGAKVFLVAPHTYLGDDMTATLRLWREPGEEPSSELARQIYADPVNAPSVPDPNRLDYTYQADLPAAPLHPDTKPPSLLCDRRWGESSHDSVQYSDNVNITADLAAARAVAGVRVIAYHRESSDRKGFAVAKVTVFTSNDKKVWQQVAVLENRPEMVEGEIATLFAPLAATTRYLKFAVQKDEQAGRMLLAEIEILGPAPAAPHAPTAERMPRPLHVKKTLDDALLAAGVSYLYGCYPTDVLRDGHGNPCGIVIANRAGRQAILAKTIVDATERARVARLAGARFHPYPAGLHTFRRVVIGGTVCRAAGISARTIPPPFTGPFPNPARTSSGTFPVIEYTLRLPMADDRDGSWAAADQQARTLTYHPEQQFTSDVLFEVPPDPIYSRQSSAAAGGSAVAEVPLDALRPQGLPRLYVLGGCADVPRAVAERLLRPVSLIALGARVGKAAAEEAAVLPATAGAGLPGTPAADPAAAGEVREPLAGLRATQRRPTVSQQARALPVLGTYDVVVIGGGTSGAPAGISAARQGAKTLVCEYLHGLGGVGTLGAISSYYWGNRVGFSATVPGAKKWVIEEKMEWWRKELLTAGGELWFGAVGCGALVENGQVTGAIVATPQGRGVVLAKVVIDATGNADVAAAAGAACLYTDQSEFAMQGTGLPPRRLGASYMNTDFTVVDETDMLDVWQVFVYSKEKYPTAFDQGTLVDTRERRRIVGDFTLSILDEINARTYPDTIVVAYSNFDTHGYTVHPYFLLEHPEERGVYVNIPYRCLVPKGLEGILVAGLGVSAQRDAIPLIRMQADMQNQGYALGVAAAMAAKAGTLVRHIDLAAVQQHLVEIGNLPARVLSDRDSYPLPAEALAQAVRSIPHAFRGSAVVLAQPEQARPLLRQAYAAAQGEAKLSYALVLALMGDAAGVDPLLAKVQAAANWDAGWNYRSMGQFGRALSPLDGWIVALGAAGDRRAVPVLLEKLRLLTAESEFSHHRAVALALERLGDPAAAKPLAELLGLAGMSGYAYPTIAEAKRRETPGGANSVQSRRESLRELVLARALYRCGDYQGLGQKILRQYAEDLRGHLARHAQAVLAEKSPSRGP